MEIPFLYHCHELLKPCIWGKLNRKLLVSGYSFSSQPIEGAFFTIYL